VLAGTSPLEKLNKLFYAREKSTVFAAPSPLALQVPVDQQRTVGICLVVVDELYHEDIWRAWVEQGEVPGARFKARLFVHAKYPDRISSAWVRAQTLAFTHSPEWNSPEVIRAMLSLLEEGLRDATVGRFVFGTESCLPIYSLATTGQKLFEHDASWLDAFNAGKSNWEAGACFRAVDSRIVPPMAVWKAIPGWVMLTRRHAAEVVCLPKASGCDLVSAWGPGGQWSEDKGGVFAPEEVFFATMLAILGYLRKDGQRDEVRRQMVTFASWQRRGDANPIAYTQFNRGMLESFRSSGCVFARKFGKGVVNRATWERILAQADTKSSGGVGEGGDGGVEVANIKASEESSSSCSSSSRGDEAKSVGVEKEDGVAVQVEVEKECAIETKRGREEDDGVGKEEAEDDEGEESARKKRK